MCIINADGFQGWGCDHKNKIIFIRTKTVEGYLEKIKIMEETGRASLEDIESLIGKLNWLSTIILQARVLAPPLQWKLNEHKVVDEVGSLQNGKKTVDLGCIILKDLKLTQFLLKNRNSKPAIAAVYNWRKWGPSIKGSSDAAKFHGIGWIVNDTGAWCSESFHGNAWAMSLDQNQSEATGALSIINHLAPRAKLTGCIIVLENDNRSVIAAVSKKGSFRASLYAFSRAIVWAEARWGVPVYLRFVEGDDNIADAPSRPAKGTWWEHFKYACAHHKDWLGGLEPIAIGPRVHSPLEVLRTQILKKERFF